MSDEQQKTGADADSTVTGPAEPAEAQGTFADAADEVSVLDNVAEADDGDASEPPQTAAAEAPKPEKPPKSGRGIAFLSLLLALGAAGGAAYVYYELIYLKPFDQQFQEQLAAVDQAVESVNANTGQAQQQAQVLDERLNGVEERFAQIKTQQSRALTNALQTQQQRLQETEQSLIESLNRVVNTAPPSEQEWKMAELEYLLRIANHRALMEKDAEGALRLLEMADAVLTELDDFGLHTVRAQLADEILALKQLGKNDVQGLFLRLEAVKRGLSGLPLQVPEYLTKPPTSDAAEEPVASDTERGVLAALAESMGTYLQFRTLETQIDPLLTPAEINYVELNLRLMLEQAQLSALRGDTIVFQQSLDNAVEWLEQYLDGKDEAVSEIVQELTALRDFSVTRELPDVSGSLQALIATERGTS